MSSNKLLRRSWTITLALVFLLASQSAHAQGQCALKIADLPAAPELLGFHLGMTKEQVKARVPQVKFPKNDDLGVSKTTINPSFDPKIDQTQFKDVRSISLDFLDDHLTSLWIGYDETYKANNIEDFVKTVSQSLHLPDAWSSWRSRGQQLRCENFQLIVTMVAGGPSFRLLDLPAEDVVANRREAKENEREAPTAADEQPPQIYGDKRTKLYYVNGCELPKGLAETDKLIFATTEDAAKAGFKPAPTCH
jgi:hypothetical protein